MTFITLKFGPSNPCILNLFGLIGVRYDNYRSKSMVLELGHS